MFLLKYVKTAIEALALWFQVAPAQLSCQKNEEALLMQTLLF